jgi:hypothetical protein
VSRGDRAVGDVLSDHGLAQTIRADKDKVARFGDEIQSEGALNQITVDFQGPTPIEIGDRFEAADAYLTQEPLEGAWSPLRELGGGDLLKQSMRRQLIARGARN